MQFCVGRQYSSFYLWLLAVTAGASLHVTNSPVLTPCLTPVLRLYGHSLYVTSCIYARRSHQCAYIYLIDVHMCCLCACAHTPNRFLCLHSCTVCLTIYFFLLFLYCRSSLPCFSPLSLFPFLFYISEQQVQSPAPLHSPGPPLIPATTQPAPPGTSQQVSSKYIEAVPCIYLPWFFFLTFPAFSKYSFWPLHLSLFQCFSILLKT